MQDIPKLMTALAEWFSCVMVLIQYLYFGKTKFKFSSILYLGISLIGLCVIQYLCGLVANILWIFGMLTAFFIMFLTIRQLVSVTALNAAFETIGVFLKAEFVAAFAWQMYVYYMKITANQAKYVEILLCSLIYIVTFGGFFMLEKKLFVVDDEFYELEIDSHHLLLISLLAILIFTFSNLSYVEAGSPFSGNDTYDIFHIRTIVDFTGVFMFEAFHLQSISENRIREKDAMNYILRMQYMQYRDSQESIDLINQKYHDLKHQLEILRNEPDDSKRRQYLDEIESGIENYENTFQTGNHVLDTILTSKGQKCKKWNINMTVVADGKLLNKIHVMDICTIFGNALDNAIEYELQIENAAERLIHLSVSQKASFLCIVVENYYDGETDNSLSNLTNTKKDKRYHGFGTRSIKHVVNKYSGHVNFTVANHWFRVEMLIPL